MLGATWPTPQEGLPDIPSFPELEGGRAVNSFLDLLPSDFNGAANPKPKPYKRSKHLNRVPTLSCAYTLHPAGSIAALNAFMLNARAQNKLTARESLRSRTVEATPGTSRVSEFWLWVGI